MLPVCEDSLGYDVTDQDQRPAHARALEQRVEVGQQPGDALLRVAGVPADRAGVVPSGQDPGAAGARCVWFSVAIAVSRRSGSRTAASTR